MQEKIKILFFQWKLVFGGTETSLFDLLSMINKDEFDITLFVMEEGGVWDQKFKNAGIKVIGPYSEIHEKKGVISDKEFFNRKKRIDKSLKNFCIGLLDVCTTEKWDIVVAYHPTDYRLGVFQKNAKTVFYLHMDPEHYLYLKDDLITSPYYYKAFDRIVSVSDYARQSFEKISGITDNVVVHFNPIKSDSVKIKSLNASSIEISKPYICAVGRLSIQKGFERLIRIHKRILDKGFFHNLVIVGDGELRDDLEKTISEVDAEDTVLLAGFQENPFPIIRNSKLLVVSSFHEGLCMAAMEAIILGVPVVSTIPTINELSGNETCGIVCDMDDESLYNSLLKMLSDEDFYKKAKEGAERRSAYFDGKRMTKEVEEEFKALYYKKTDYRQKRKYVRKEIKRVRKTIDRDWRHLPNRILRSVLGVTFYEKFKQIIKNTLDKPFKGEENF